MDFVLVLRSSDEFGKDADHNEAGHACSKMFFAEDLREEGQKMC